MVHPLISNDGGVGGGRLKTLREVAGNVMG
jgi:hypothetical protein